MGTNSDSKILGLRTRILAAVSAFAVALAPFPAFAAGDTMSSTTTTAPTNAQEAARERQNTNANAMANGSTAAGQGSYGAGYADQMIVERGTNTQRGNQIGNTNNGNDGNEKSQSLAGNLFSIGTGLIAAGVAITASCRCPAGLPLIAMGMFFNAGGSGAQGAGNQMGNMAGISDGLKNNLDSTIDTNKTGTNKQDRFSTSDDKSSGAIDIGGTSSDGSKGGRGVGGFRVDTGKDMNPLANGFSVDEGSLRSGKLGETFDKLEKDFGIDRNEFARAMLSGEDIGEYLAKNNLTGGQGADEFSAALGKQPIDPEALRERMENGEFDEYKGLVEFAGGGDAIDNKGAGDPKKDASGAAKLPGGKSYDQLMAEIFGKKPGSLEDVKDKILSEELKKDAQLRALASNSDYKLSSDYIKDGIYSEKTLFERVNRVYKLKADGMIPEDFYIRLQAERDMNRFR